MMIDDETAESLRAENARLRGRVAELETAHRRLSHLLQATIDHVDAVIFLRDADGIFTFINEAYVEVTGLPRDAVIGKRDCDVFPEEVYEPFRVADRLVAATHRRIEQEEVLPLDDGLHTYLSVKFPVLDDDGPLVAVGGISTDISEHKRVEAALRETRSILHAIIENAPLVMFATDRHGRYILVSREAARQLGRAPQDILGRTDSEIMSAAALEKFRDHSDMVLGTDQPQVREDIVDREGGQQQIYLDTKFPIRDVSGQVYAICSVVTDITDIRRAEEQQRRLDEDLIKAQQFALQELSTPLIPIAAGAVAMPLIGTIDRDRMQQIVGALLDGVTRHRARIAILDLTGLRRVEAAIMRELILGVQAARLLGAEVVLTGVQPRMAATLLDMGVPLDQITALQTLQSGIAYALRRLRH